MAFDFGGSFDRNRQLLLACTFAFSIACAVAKSQGRMPNCYKKRSYGWGQPHLTTNSEERINLYKQHTTTH